MCYSMCWERVNKSEGQIPVLVKLVSFVLSDESPGLRDVKYISQSYSGHKWQSPDATWLWLQSLHSFQYSLLLRTDKTGWGGGGSVMQSASVCQENSSLPFKYKWPPTSTAPSGRWIVWEKVSLFIGEVLHNLDVGALGAVCAQPYSDTAIMTHVPSNCLVSKGSNCLIKRLISLHTGCRKLCCCCTSVPKDMLIEHQR